MVMGILECALMSRTSSSVWLLASRRSCEWHRGKHTLLVVCVLEVLGTEKRFGKLAVPALDDKRFPLLDDLIPHELLKFELPDLVGWNALDPFKVGRPIDQSLQVQVRWNWVEFGLGVCCYARHSDS